MKCYEIAPKWHTETLCYTFGDSPIREGIAVSMSTEGMALLPLSLPLRSSVRTAPTLIQRALFAPELATKLLAVNANGVFTHAASRIHRCDLEVTSDVWLSSETAATKDDVLLLIWYLGIFNRKTHSPIAMKVNGPEASIVLSDEVTYQMSNFARHTGKIALVHLKPGDSFEVDWACWRAKTPGSRSVKQCFTSAVYRSGCRITAMPGAIAPRVEVI
jgi:hypothetical protein